MLQMRSNCAMYGVAVLLAAGSMFSGCSCNGENRSEAERPESTERQAFPRWLAEHPLRRGRSADEVVYAVLHNKDTTEWARSSDISWDKIRWFFVQDTKAGVNLLLEKQRIDPDRSIAMGFLRFIRRRPGIEAKWCPALAWAISFCRDGRILPLSPHSNVRLNELVWQAYEHLMECSEGRDAAAEIVLAFDMSELTGHNLPVGTSLSVQDAGQMSEEELDRWLVRVLELMRTWNKERPY